MKKSRLIIITVLVFVGLFLSTISAHDSYRYYPNAAMQTSDAGNQVYCLSSSNGNWEICFTGHSALQSNNAIRYYFDYSSSDMDAFNSWRDSNGDLVFENTNAFESFVNSATNIWTDEIPQLNFEQVQSSYTNGVVGRITAEVFENNTSAFAVATYSPSDIDSDGHLITWELSVNIKQGREPEEQYIAHEFGHIIGLNDVNNWFCLMTGTADFMESTPRDEEVFAANLILGLHQHTDVGEMYQSTSYGYGQHKLKCSICEGYKVQTPNSQDYRIELCTYGADDRCIVCGAFKGSSINSIEDDLIE